ncbi:MAG: phosphate ABC transporter permease PstA [Pseudomonadota bacterium]
MDWLYMRRRFFNAFNLSVSVLTTLFGLFWLAWILWTTFDYGIDAINWKLVSEITPPPGSNGGLANAFVGSLIMIALAILIGTPIGILAGTYLGEFAGQRRIGGIIRFINDILLSAPSIIIGLFVYALVVKQLGHFSGLAGGLALAIILIPVVLRTTDEMLRLVPSTMREAALALGAPYWLVVTKVTYRAAMSGILTGVLLALARISGETAPLLFTALSNQFWSLDLLAPMANVPVVIFQFAMSPYEDWHALAWAGALVMTLVVLFLSIVSRLIISKGKIEHE